MAVSGSKVFCLFDNVHASVQHMQAIQRETKACYQETLTYSYDNYLGIFYVHYHPDMITHNTALDKPVDGIGQTSW